MSNFAIQVENLSKCYRIGLKEQISDTFGGAIGAWIKAPVSNLKRVRRLTRFDADESESDDLIWALSDVSFTVESGDVIGVIGRNGAGKSTLLKILSRITEPTAGRVLINGRVSSLLEVGTGFHPELTGRENVYLNGTVLGMTKKEVDTKFDEIVSFAEVEKFIDTPIKRYSSGMKVRLAFAVAAHLEPEILLVDEVLAVGDMAFQKKCLGKMEDVSKRGRTVLFVSHNMGAVRNLCQNGILLESGRIESQGEAFSVVDDYVKGMLIDASGIWINDCEEDKQKSAWIKQIEILDENNMPRDSFFNSEPIYIKFSLFIRETDSHLKIGFDLFRNGENVFRSHQVDSLEKVERIPEGTVELVCEIPENLLTFGDYYITPLLSIHCVQNLEEIDSPVIKFRVEIDTSRSYFHAVLNERNQPGAVFPLLRWELR